MGFIINKSYSRDIKSIDNFYARIEQVTVERLPGTAYAMIQYFRSREDATKYTMGYSRETWETELNTIPFESFPLDFDEETLIDGVSFKMPEPYTTGFRIGCYGFYFPLGDLEETVNEEYEMIDSFVEMPYIDFDDDGNPVEMTKQIPCKDRVLIKSTPVVKTKINIMQPELLENPYKYLYTRIKPELEKIFGEGSIIDDL